jgi:tRNA (cmo5U34)-methyltransferase
METDQIFKKKFNKVNDFQFSADVVNVFDDMVVRSVPFYLEMQRMIAEIAAKHAQPATSLYDLGCSTGTTFLSLTTKLDKTIKLVGVDEAPEMLKSCKANLEEHKVENEFELLNFNLNKSVKIENASVVILCLTLQFVRPINRARLIQSIYDQLNPGGCIILIEKVLGEGNLFNREFIEYYYDMKNRNNYNEMEIAQKREALENILVPYKLSENIEMLFNAGFKECETFFKWYNFAGMVAIK